MRNNEFHQYKNVNNPEMVAQDRVLVCPNCREELARADIESFPRCPFCDYPLGNSRELEDFILEPLVDSWMRQQPGFKPQTEDSFGGSMIEL